MQTIDFKKGAKVKFKVVTMHGVHRGKGVVTALVPKGAIRGAARLTVKGDDGKVRKLFVAQCTAA